MEIIMVDVRRAGSKIESARYANRLPTMNFYVYQTRRKGSIIRKNLPRTRGEDSLPGVTEPIRSAARTRPTVC